MIVRKPYAFLIKYFKLIHIAMFAILSLFVFQLRNIYVFFKNYVKSGHFTYFENMADRYIKVWMIILVIVIIVAAIFIYLLMRKKEKPVLFYKVLFIYSFVLFIVLLVYRSFFCSLEYLTPNNLSLVIYRDITGFLYYINYFYVAFTFARGFGFDIKKFSFDKDRKELKLETEDNEEYEVSLNIDKEDIIKSLRKEKREFGYYLKENKVTLILILGIVLLSVGVYFFIDKFVVNKTYHENDTIESNQFLYKVSNSYLTDKNKYGEIISKNDQYLVVNFEVYNRSSNTLTIPEHTFRLHIGDKYLFPDETRVELFNDLGIPYKDHKIKPRETKKYLLIFKISKELNYEKISLEILENNRYKEVLLEYQKEENVIHNYSLSEIAKVGEYQLSIESYQIKNKLIYNYQECSSEDNCGTYTKIVVPNLNDLVLSFEINSEVSLDLKFLENYVFVNMDGTIISSRDIEVLDYYENTIYLSVASSIEKAQEINLGFNVRGRVCYFKLK